ncbi:GIY-YIG domain-containing protein [Rhodovastum atsumiense]|nr:GIY-YIG domain-containing protein [Rhodovastum atsumiense]
MKTPTSYQVPLRSTISTLPSARPILIYEIRRTADGKRYVGLTQRPLPVRFTAHCADAMRDGGRRGRHGTITEAIREVLRAGQKPRERFITKVLEVCADLTQARRAEKAWIARLGTAAPTGFNLMPGGASVGGPGNAKEISFSHPVRGELRFPAISAALADINAERLRSGFRPLAEATVCARLELGWPTDEAFELVDHRDARTRRPPFLWHGRRYDSLRDLARVEGLPIATARSRLHRARQAGHGESHDAGTDRRCHATQQRCRAARLALPDPRSSSAPPVDAATFARLTGIPRATVLTRWHRLRRRNTDVAELDPTMVLAALQTPVDRRVHLTLVLPDGRRVAGGVREVIRQVLDDPGLKGGRIERLGESAIRARLRRLPGWPQGPFTEDAISWAFGFTPGLAGAVHPQARGV